MSEYGIISILFLQGVKQMKRFVSILMIAALVLSLAFAGGSSETTKASDVPTYKDTITMAVNMVRKCMYQALRNVYRLKIKA